MALHGATLIHKRNQYYQRSHYRLLVMAFFSVALNVVLASIVAYLISYGTLRVYFATSADGKLLEKVRLDIPFLNEEQLRAFVKEATESATSFDFLNYRKNLMDSRPYFTPTGFSNYLEAFESSGNFNTVKLKKFVVQGNVVGKAEIKPFPKDGVYGWVVTVPVNLTYENVEERLLQPLTANLLIRRVPTSQAKTAVLVEQFVLNDRKS